MLAQDELIFRLLLKMTVGKGPCGKYIFGWACAHIFVAPLFPGLLQGGAAMPGSVRGGWAPL